MSINKGETTSNAVDILDSMFGDDPGYQQACHEAKINAMIARDIYRLRQESGLTQAQLATLVGTKQSVISRLEDADYEGHSLPMLDRIARALRLRLSVQFTKEDDEQGRSAGYQEEYSNVSEPEPEQVFA